MKFLAYLKDHLLEIFSYWILFFLIFLLLLAFQVSTELIVAIFLLFLLVGIPLLLFPFYRKKIFYDNLLDNLSSMDQKYLLHEMINRPSFLEGEILYDAMYEVNKSMMEYLNIYKNHLDEFKEYMELWVHEIKIPISSCFLITHNHALESSKKLEEELARIEDFVEQILYYARSENVEKDYLVRSADLKTIVRNVVQKNKSRILYKHIKLDISVGEKKVRTDSKWLEFILHQILNNSIQYARGKDAEIRIWTEKKEKQLLLHIKDNGFGIAKSDLPHVFEKGFTGKNGRTVSTSTGMGLYLVKKLAQKMNHKVLIDSVQGEYTTFTVIFFETDFYDVLD